MCHLSSWGEGCGVREFPGVYAQVDVVADWIEEEICRNSCYPPDTCDPEIRHPCADIMKNAETDTTTIETNVNFTIKVAFDSYPSEVGFMLTNVNNSKQVWIAQYGTFSGRSGEKVKKAFSGLPSGIYHLVSPR